MVRIARCVSRVGCSPTEFLSLQLIEASRSGSMQRATKAIRKGAEIDETDAVRPSFASCTVAECKLLQDGKAALHYASKFGHVHIIELLIDKKANIDLRSLVRVHCSQCRSH